MATWEAQVQEIGGVNVKNTMRKKSQQENKINSLVAAVTEMLF